MSGERDMVSEARNAGGEAVDPARDRPGLVIRTLLGGTLAGTAAVAFVLWCVRTLLAGAAASDRPVTTGPAFYVLMFGTLAAVALAVAIAWRMLAPLSSSWRRGVFAMISGFGTIVAALGAAPIHHTWGRTGLAMLAGAGAAGALLVFATGRRSP